MAKGHWLTPHPVWNGLTERLGEAYAALDADIARDADTMRREQGAGSPCHAGCDACCHGQVTIGLVEALGIVLHALRPGDDLDERRRRLLAIRPAARKQADRLARRPASAPTWFGPCVLLKHRLCSVHPMRPLVCRLYLSWERTPDPCYDRDGVVKASDACGNMARLQHRMGMHALMARFGFDNVSGPLPAMLDIAIDLAVLGPEAYHTPSRPAWQTRLVAALRKWIHLESAHPDYEEMVALLARTGDDDAGPTDILNAGSPGASLSGCPPSSSG